MAAGTAGSDRVNDEVVDVALDDVVPLHPPTRINAKMTSTSDVLLLWGLLPPCIGGNLVVGLVPGRARPSPGADWEATYIGVGTHLCRSKMHLCQRHRGRCGGLLVVPLVMTLTHRRSVRSQTTPSGGGQNSHLGADGSRGELVNVRR
jgi:hypothetical protein